jgi:tRNA uridine 5-carboxymethylaminomethyl modification enzyme
MHAAARALGREPAALDRGNSYIAVMVDDLTLHGVSEPYRMLTARAEYRLRLRANNAATRLTPPAIAAGCVGDERRAWFERREGQRTAWGAALDREVTSAALADAGVPVRRDAGRRPLAEWLRFPDVALGDFAPWLDAAFDLDSELAHELAEDAAYAPYLERQDGELRDLRASEAVALGDGFPFAEVPGLSNEMIERLAAACPANLSAAGRVRGITPAALAALLVYARRRALAA